MKVLSAFFKLIRWPNLVFIALTQMLFRFIILKFVYAGSSGGAEAMKVSLPLFYGLVFASVCIAAAGYVINDYFDINIDLVNKPSRLIIDRYIKRRWAIVLHIVLSLAGLVISGYVGFRIGNFYIPVLNFGAILLLWLYSTTFKKRLLIGNVVISLLTAWVILVLTLSEYRFPLSIADRYEKRLLKISLIYAGFAFMISLVREIIKDMEDMQGDAKHGCKTMPIVWGMQVSKVFAGVWLVVILGLVAGIQIYILQSGWWLSALYSLVAILIPLFWVLRKLYEANSPSDFHRLSTAVKLIMLAGILSMIFY